VARTREWKLVVVGLGKVREYVELVERLGLGLGRGKEGDPPKGGTTSGGARVMFIGPTKEMEAVYAAADALLLPTFYEVSNVVALEALGHGLAVVSTAFLGMAEAVRAARAGRIVGDPRDVGALAAALEGLPAAGSAEGEGLARRARAAAAGFSAAGYGERLERLYREAGGR
jgi:glycosyltransferase involved in cell wall biosynthesis